MERAERAGRVVPSTGPPRPALSFKHFPRLERRTSARISPKGSAFLTAAEWSTRGRIVNVGVGGALLRARTPVGAVGEAVEIELRLDGASRRWMRLPCRVTRIELAAIAVEVASAPDEFEALIAEVSLASRTNVRRLSVVLIDESVGRRIQIAEAFRAAGCAVIDVSTPLGAIVELGQSQFEPDLIAIADSLPESVSEELRGFVESEHPAARLVRIGNDRLEPVGLANWLSTMNPQNDLVDRIRRLLGT